MPMMTGPRRQQPSEDQGQQLASNDPAVPVRLAEHVVIEREVGGLGQPHDAQHGAHGAFAGRETAPVTSTRTWSQTGAVKKSRKATISETIAGGTIAAVSGEGSGER